MGAESTTSIRFDLVAGIDGGASKTICAVADREGRILARGRGGPSNYHAEGLDRARASLAAAVGEALAALGAEAGQVSAVCAGLAGVARLRDREAVAPVLRELFPAADIRLESDAKIALVGGTGGRPGVIVSAGTGSVAYGMNAAGKETKVGGWGYLFGDEGSGYDIARRGLAAVLRAFDGRGSATSLQEAFLNVLHLDQPDDLIPVLYSNPLSPARVAALFPLVLREADRGDGVAVGIIRDAAEALAELAVTAALRLGLAAEPCPIVTAGGVFRGELLRRWFGKAVQGRLPEARIEDPAAPPEVGAVRLALEAAAGGREKPRPERSEP